MACEAPKCSRFPGIRERVKYSGQLWTRHEAQLSYELIGNKIHSTACEVNVSHHCNMSCRACSHLSPSLKRHFADPDAIFDDLSTLGIHYHARQLRLLGGEPLLHPNLLEIIDAARESGIADRIRILTNGTLLNRMSREFWKKVDEVSVSVYPGKEPSAAQLKSFTENARTFGVQLEIFHFDRFRVSYSELGSSDRILTSRIYRTCQIAHRWNCHNIHTGYFFKCPQSIFIAHMLMLNVSQEPQMQDGLEIVDSLEFRKDLLSYLESPRPLNSCSHCLGSVGKLFNHEQVPRSEWRNYQMKIVEEMVDYEYLDLLEADDPDMDNSCLRL